VTGYRPRITYEHWQTFMAVSQRSG